MTEITFTHTFEDREAYERAMLGADFAGPRDATLRIELPLPYRGPRPRLALWGARRRDVQVGSAEDEAWQRAIAMATGTLTIDLPHVTFR